MPLVHHVFHTVEQENEFYQKHPGIHLVKAVVVGKQTHLWVADNPEKYRGQHMQAGGAPNY